MTNNKRVENKMLKNACVCVCVCDGVMRVDKNSPLRVGNGTRTMTAKRTLPPVNRTLLLRPVRRRPRTPTPPRAVRVTRKPDGLSLADGVVDGRVRCAQFSRRAPVCKLPRYW